MLLRGPAPPTKNGAACPQMKAIFALQLRRACLKWRQGSENGGPRQLWLIKGQQMWQL